MPNYVLNKISIGWPTNNEDERTKKWASVLEAVKSDVSDFDFNKLIPMPEVLKRIKSPVDIVSEDDYIVML